MNYESLVSRSVSKNAHRMLSVRLDSISLERLRRAHSISCALAQWRSVSTPTGGVHALSHVMATNVQNAFKVPLVDGTHGWLFILNVRVEPSFLKFRRGPQNTFQIIDLSTVLYEAADSRCFATTAKPMVRFASVSPSQSTTILFSLRVRTFKRCWKECGPAGSGIKTQPPQRGFTWLHSKAMRDALGD